MEIIETLFSLKDEEYKKFHCKLMPTVNSDNVIGVRIPIIRKLAKEISDEEYAVEFRNTLPHKFYEENNLHVFFINGIKDYSECIFEVNRFLPYIDNWATCDSLRPVCFARNKDRLITEIKKWIESDKTYTVRFAIEMLMVYYLEEAFDNEYLDMVASVSHDDYYVKMMIAWYFATALAKRWKDIVPYLEKERLDKWIHNKTISKAIESFRITKEQKEYLRKMRKK